MSPGFCFCGIQNNLETYLLGHKKVDCSVVIVNSILFCCDRICSATVYLGCCISLDVETQFRKWNTTNFIHLLLNFLLTSIIGVVNLFKQPLILSRNYMKMRIGSYNPVLLGTFHLFPTQVENIKYFYFRRFNNYTIVFISEIVIQNLLVLEISETMKTHLSQLH